MAVAHPIQSSFTGGELSPRLGGQVRFQKYDSGASTILNGIVAPHGGVTRRAGTKYVAEVKDSSKAVRLIPFIFSTEQAYVLEFGDQYIRIYRDQGQVESGGSPVEVVTPYLEADLFDLQVAQSADVLYIAHNDYAPRELTRTSDTAWSLNLHDFVDGPYGPLNDDTSKTLQASATTGSVTITAAGHTPFASTDVGRLVRIKASTEWGYAEITAYTSSTVVTATVKSDFDGTGTSSDWRLGEWYDEAGWPGSVSFFEQRLWWAATKDKPQTLWGSQSGDFTDHGPGVEDDDAVAYTIASNQVNSITWLSASRVLSVGTAGGAFVVSGQDAITPTNVRIVPQVEFGGARIVPVRAGEVALYVQNSRRSVREFVYDFTSDSYVASNVTLLAEHITKSGIKDIGFQQERNPIFWAALYDGTLIGMTYERNQKIFAWHKHVLGGTSDAAGTQAKVESIAIIPGALTGADYQDEVWCLVQRYVNGSVVRYVEYLTPQFDIEDDQEIDAFFLDSGLTLNSPITVSGATAANPVVVTATAHGLSDGDVVRIRDVAGMTELNHRSFTVANKTTNTFELSGADGSGYTAYISGGTARKEVSSVSGISHLEGETVQILADGAVQPEAVVSSGAVTLAEDASIVHVGLGYNTDVETLRYEAGQDEGTAQGRTKRITRAVLRLHQTLGVEAGPRVGALDRIPFRSSADAMDEAPALFSGDKKLALPSGWETDGRIFIRQSQPLPFTILAIMPEISTNR